MKTIFLELNTLYLGPYSTIERLVKFNHRERYEVICANLLDPRSIRNLNRLCKSVQNLWFVILSDWTDILGMGEIRGMLKIAGFDYAHRVFDYVPKYTNVKATRISKWLRDNALENEINSFCIVDIEPAKGLLENYSVTVNYDIGLSEMDLNIIVNNFKANEYKLEKVWRAITAKQ